MVLRLRVTLAFTATALMAVIVSFVLQAMIPGTLVAALLAMVIAGALAARFGQMFGGALAQSLSELNSVILRFIKWDMEGMVPHAARADEVGKIARALKTFQSDAIRWSESHTSEQDNEIQGRLASQQRAEELIHQFRGSTAGILGAFADSARMKDETARALSTVASDSNERVVMVASASDEASSNVQTVAATPRSLPSRWARSARASPPQAASSARSPRTPAPPISIKALSKKFRLID
jgi:methyl-accepting chemotaxis protein